MKIGPNTNRWSKRKGLKTLLEYQLLTIAILYSAENQCWQWAAVEALPVPVSPNESGAMAGWWSRRVGGDRWTLGARQVCGTLRLEPWAGGQPQGPHTCTMPLALYYTTGVIIGVIFGSLLNIILLLTIDDNIQNALLKETF